MGPTTVVDNGWKEFQPRYGLQQAPVGISQYSASPMYSPRQMMYDQRYGTGLSQDTIVKIHELNRLMNKYPKYNMNPGGIIQW